jgi:hypothetical protein
MIGRATQEKAMLTFIAQGAFFGEVLSALAWYRKKIETTLRNMKTGLGRMMAMERLPYGEDFLQRFEAENSGLIEKKRSEIQKLCSSE